MHVTETIYIFEMQKIPGRDFCKNNLERRKNMDYYIIICAICFLCGIIVNELLQYLKKCYGVLRIDQTDPEKDMYRFEIDNLDDLSKKRYIVLKIEHSKDLSQK